MRHDKHRDVLRSVPDGSAVAAAASGATIAIPPSSVAVAASALASTTGGAECDGVSASSSSRESVAADNAFRLVLDASPDGLPVLVWQRVPRCEQQRVLPRGRMEPRLLW